MKNNITELVFILDRSGSMAGFEADTIGGFNATIEKQKAQEGKVYVSTALLDAIGGAIHHIGNVHKYARPEDVPEHTIFVITTDGMENASRRYSAREIKEKIKRQTEKYGWEFIFLAANIDAVGTAENIGIKRERAVNYNRDCAGIQVTYEAMSEAITAMRCSHTLDAGEWRKNLDKDNKRRRK